MNGGRRERLERNLARSLADHIPHLRDPRIPVVVTVERVRLSPDMRSAFVLVSSLEGDIDEVAMALNRASGFLQRRLADELELKRTPRLTFTHDPTLVPA